MRVKEKKAFLGGLIGGVVSGIFGGGSSKSSSSTTNVVTPPTNLLMSPSSLMHPVVRSAPKGGDQTAVAQTERTSFDSDPIQFAHYLIRNIGNLDGGK